MKIIFFAGIFLLSSVSLWSAREATNKKDSASPPVPRVFLLDGKRLLSVQQQIKRGDTNFSPALEKLQKEAQTALKAGPFTVVDQFIPPGGTRHDYMSQAPYFWPDPKSTNGLPYIRKDGERNPEINKLPDHASLNDLVEFVETLSLAYFFIGEERYAVKASQLLRAWFLAPATRMSPHLQFAQAIPGVNTGRGIGLIETRGLSRIVDSVGLLERSESWRKKDQEGLKEWFNQFLQWMLESKNGRDEAAAKNNHGTYYDLQTASFALFVGKDKLAKSILGGVMTRRIPEQIEPDGKQPLEIARTKAWTYSIGNLNGLMSLARLGENAGLDLWNFQTADGRGLRKAIDYLLPFGLGEKKFPHQQLGGFSAQPFYPLLRKAAVKFPEANYRLLLSKIPARELENRSHLTEMQPTTGKETIKP